MPNASSRSLKQQFKTSTPETAAKWWTVRDILQERKRRGQIEYLVDWEDDPETHEQYPPSWTSSKDVTTKAIFDWKKKQKVQLHRHHQEAGEQEEESDEEGTSTVLPGNQLDSSQPVQPLCRRKRTWFEISFGSSGDSKLEDSEGINPPNPPKRRCSEAHSLHSSGSEADTDAASDILANTASTFFVAIPSKLDYAASVYISVSDSQGSKSLGSQSVSALEDQDNQVLLTENLSQGTIPDSQEQDYPAFDTQDSQPVAVPTGLPIIDKQGNRADFEISDSQKLSSLGTSQSKTAGSQVRPFNELDCHYQPPATQSPLQLPRLESSQDPQESLELSDYASLTEKAILRTQQPIIPNTSPIILVSQSPNVRPIVQRVPRSDSPDSVYLDAQAAAQLIQEQDSIPASIPDTSIPSHQVDDLPIEHSAEKSSHCSTVANHHRPSQPEETVVFLTQPEFDFDEPPSQTHTSQKGASTSVSGVLEKQICQTADQNEPSSEEFVVISNTQSSNSCHTQHAQVVPPLPDISASQNGSTSGITDEDCVPDTIRRRPRSRPSIITNQASTPVRSRVVSNVFANRTFEASQHNDEDNQGESFRTCLDWQSVSPTNSITSSEGSPARPSGLASIMDDNSTSGEPLSAIEELMRIQEAALQGTLGQSSLPSSIGDLGRLRDDGGRVNEPNDEHVFPASLDTPSIQINSQPPVPSHWQLEGAVSSSTDMPALSSTPVVPVTETPVDEAPQTATMGDIFSSNLVPPSSAEPLPTTISPSDISRSIEPDESLAAIHPQDDQTLDILPMEDTTTGKSTASSPDVEENFPSHNPTFMDQNEYHVTLMLPAHIRPLYKSTIAAYKREIEQYNRICRSGEALPDPSLVDAIRRFLGQLRDICDLPASLDGPSIDALPATDLKKHATGTNSKYFFVDQFLERLQTSHKRILIVVRDINIMGYLEAVVGTGDMAYSRKGLHELESQDEHSLLIILLHAEQALVDDLSDFDVVIGFDSGLMQTDIPGRWAQMNGKKPMLIRLMTTYSIEHLEPMLPSDMDDLERENALLVAIFQSRNLIANEEQGEMIDSIAALFASQAIVPSPSFEWEAEPIPSAVLDIYGNTQSQSQMPPTTDESTSRKRKALTGSQEVTKRVRMSPSPGGTAGSIDDAVHSHLNPNPSRLQVQTTQDHLDSLNTKVSELENQLEEKTSLESDLRKHIVNLSKRVKSHDKTINLIQEKHMAALRERSIFEAERDQAKQNEEKAWETSRGWQNKAETFEEELKKKSATLDQALENAGTIAVETFQQRTEELEKSQAKIAELEKKLESRDSELNYARDAYQTANHANSELSRENQELKDRLDALLKQAASSLAQVQTLNAGEQVKEMQKQIAETQAISKDREKELARVEKELRALKNGRRETRQQSVPRSPRLGMMSPRTGRAAGGSTSRGTSPTPYESTGSTPIPGMQFFNTPANGRWGHLRD